MSTKENRIIFFFINLWWVLQNMQNLQKMHNMQNMQNMHNLHNLQTFAQNWNRNRRQVDQ